MATSLPSHAVLGPLTYAISSKRRDWRNLAPGDIDGHWGMTVHAAGAILLNPDSNPDLLRVTLLHELLHAAAFAGGQLTDRKRTEEEWVALVAPQLLDALTRSPGLIEYLAGE